MKCKKKILRLKHVRILYMDILVDGGFFSRHFLARWAAKKLMLPLQAGELKVDN